MATTKKKITDLPEITNVAGMFTLAVDANNASGKFSLSGLKNAEDAAKQAAKTANDAAGTANGAASAANNAAGSVEAAKKAATDAAGLANSAAGSANTAAGRANTAAGRAEALLHDLEDVELISDDLVIVGGSSEAPDIEQTIPARVAELERRLNALVVIDDQLI